MTPAPALRRAFERALATFDVESQVGEVLVRVLRPRVAPDLVIAVGKMAGPMARAASALVPKGTPMLVIAPDAARIGLRAAAVLRAGHPLADVRSARAAHAVRQAVAASTNVLVLLSGGASALLCEPTLPLPQYRALVQGLLRAGASISEINTVRRQLSLTAGGRLAALAHPRPMLTVAVSDVIAGRLRDIGSGPTLGDSGAPAQARAILSRYGLFVPPGALRAGIAPGDPRLAHARFVLALSARHFLAHLASLLVNEGLVTTMLPPSLQSASKLAEAYGAAKLRHGHCLLRAAEPRVHVLSSKGAAGGRCTHTAALVAMKLRSGHAFLAGATDGVDGASGTGGAVVDESLAGESLAASLAAFDTGTALRAAGATLPQGPTGLNFADVHVLARG
jgi:glycerate 2-kinase